MRLCDHEVLKPAAPAVPDREIVLVHGGQANRALAFRGEQDVRLRVLDSVPQALAASLGRVVEWRDARRFEQLLDEREDCGLVLQRCGADRDGWRLTADRLQLLAGGLKLANLRREGGNDLFPVAGHGEARRLENACVRVLVDSDDVLDRGDARHVLARAGDANGDIKVRRHNLSCEAHLVRNGIPAEVAHRAARADCATQHLRQLLQGLEPFGPSKAAPAADDHLRVLQSHALRLLFATLDDARADITFADSGRLLDDLAWRESSLVGGSWALARTVAICGNP